MGFLLFLLFLFLIAWAIGFAVDECTKGKVVASLAPSWFPAEIRNPDSVESLEDQTARTLELKRKLDAETQLASSKIAVARAKAELLELNEYIRTHAPRRKTKGS